MREKYESLALADLKEIAKARGIKGVSAMKKAEVVEAMLAEDEKSKISSEKLSSDLDSGIEASGILEVMPDGYGFIRCENYMPGDNDVYVSPAQIRKLNLKTGDKGIALTRLALIGNAEFDGKIIEVRSSDGFIDEKCEIEIDRIWDGVVMVRKVALS